MKISLLIIPFLISYLSLDCDKFKTGKFEVQSKYVGKILIERDDSFQTETMVASGNVVRYRITWLSSCSFIMYDHQLIKGKELISDSKLVEEMNNDTILNEIIEINGNQYKTKSKFYKFPDWFESVSKKIE